MSVHKDKKRGTWRVALHYEDAAGKLVNTTKRGFRTKSEALAWERDMLADASASIDMRFSAFYKIYEKEMRINELLGETQPLAIEDVEVLE